MSAHKGLYIQRLSDGVIHSLQVRDVGGIELPLSPSDYLFSLVYLPFMP